LLLAGGLLLGQWPWLSKVEGATLFASREYGYSIVVPDGWEVTRGDCAASQEFTAPDQASLIHVAVTHSAAGLTAIRHVEQQSLTRFGSLHGKAAFSRKAISGHSFEMLVATVRTAGGLGVAGRVAATTAGGMLYVFTGAAYPFNADHGLGVLNRIVAAFLSIRITGHADAAACGTKSTKSTRGTTTPGARATAVPTRPRVVATPVPTTAPPAQGGQGGQQAGGPFNITVAITPNPVPRSVGHATATVQTLPYISCTASLTYDNVRNPLGALFGVSPQMTDGYGRTSWGWSIDFMVSGGTVTVTCNHSGVTESASAHFTVQ
jgi:hypothetical protein